MSAQGLDDDLPHRPLIVGLNNPISGHPDDALVPWPAGCTGARLLATIQTIRPDILDEDYLLQFDRMNLWRGRVLPRGHGTTAALKSEGARVFEHALGRPDVVLLGARVWQSVLGTKPPEYYQPVTVNGRTRFWRLPHPSGRNALFNSPHHTAQAAAVLVLVLVLGGAA